MWACVSRFVSLREGGATLLTGVLPLFWKSATGKAGKIPPTERVIKMLHTRADTSSETHDHFKVASDSKKMQQEVGRLESKPGGGSQHRPPVMPGGLKCLTDNVCICQAETNGLQKIDPRASKPQSAETAFMQSDKKN